MVTWGAHVSLWVADSSWPIVRNAISAAAAQGLDFVQLSLGTLARTDVSAVRQCLDDHGLSAVAGLSLASDAVPSEFPEKATFALKTAIDTSAALGVTLFTGALYTPIGFRTGHSPSDQEIARTAEVLKTAAQHAADCGITVGIEPLNRYETWLVNTASQALRLIDLVNEPNVLVQLDTFHMNIEELSFADPIISSGRRLGYLQLSESDRGVPGRGNVKWNDVFRGLRAIEYDGPLALESFNASSPLASSTCLWRDVVGDPDAFVSEAIRFLKGQWESS